MEKKRVLVLDDEPKNRKMIGSFLLFKHFIVDEAENGMEGMNLLAANSYDLVISDIEMPTMNGYEFLTRKGRKSTIKDIPVIMLSSLEETAVKQKCISLGASDYIVKPFTKQKIDESLGKLGF